MTVNGTGPAGTAGAGPHRAASGGAGAGGPVRGPAGPGGPVRSGTEPGGPVRGGAPTWRPVTRGSAVEAVAGNRREAEVRSLLDLPHPPARPDLAQRAVRRGTRLLRLRRARDTVLWLLLLASLIALAVAGTVAVRHERPPVAPLIQER